MVYAFVQKTTKRVICRFDLESETWENRIKGPPIPKKSWIQVSLGDLSGSLCVGTTDPRQTSRGWEIWLLADPCVNNMWVKAYTISSRAYSHLTPLKVLPRTDKLLFYGGTAEGQLLQIYDPDDGTCADVAKMPDDFYRKISLCTLRLERFVR
jgi:hypothetical protein